jgi:thiol-disulfide isomerase/thioredoxin
MLSRLHLPVERRIPEFAGATAWVNSAPLKPAELEGKVVAVDFWTFTCINWLRTLPSLRAWNQTYREHGLVVVGVHTPEFEVEHDIENVRRAVREMDVSYPIAIDNDYAVWDAFANQYWPALYVADAQGRMRHHNFGEGDYDNSERAIRLLLKDAGARDLPDALAPLEPRGIEVAADWHNLRSPETYLGSARSERFASPEPVAIDEPSEYTAASPLRVNQWALEGNFTVERENAVCNKAGGRISYRFHARDLNLILVPPGAPGRFRVRLDGGAPSHEHGLDIDEDGNGVVHAPRLHQLIRQTGPIADRLFEIEFLDPGAAALCFTFG